MECYNIQPLAHVKNGHNYWVIAEIERDYQSAVRGGEWRDLEKLRVSSLVPFIGVVLFVFLGYVGKDPSRWAAFGAAIASIVIVLSMHVFCSYRQKFGNWIMSDDGIRRTPQEVATLNRPVAL